MVTLGSAQALSWLEGTGSQGHPEVADWSEATRKRVAGGLLKAGVDLGLLQGRVKRRFTAYYLADEPLLDVLLQALITEHSNSAVKSALARFLAAPPPVAPTRTRASRTPRASSGTSTPRRARGSAAVVDAEATRQVLLALTAAPSDGLAKTQIADQIGVGANALTAVIKQLKESGQIEQLGERRGARYVLSEQGRAAVASQAGEDG